MRPVLSLALKLALVVPVAAQPLAGRIGEAVKGAIDRKETPGAVVLYQIGGGPQVLEAFGTVSGVEKAPAVARDTIYDLASLTKPVATATSVFVLLDRGKLKLSDPVAKHWPEFKANGKEKVTVKHLLLHTSGLIADNALADYADGRAKAMDRIAALPLQAAPGERCTYSDVGFIVLGELVERLSGKPLDEFARENVFKPLAMADTGFNPGKDPKLKARCAPTAKKGDGYMQGEVHDPRAAAMGGAAGHAGLFGTAADLARYCRMLLGGGELDGKRVLSRESVRLMTAAVPVPGGGWRSRGLDVATGFTAQRGDFPVPDGFGHTGFTGTSVWVDPPTRSLVVILTNRVHFGEKVSVTRLRREVAEAVCKEAAGGKALDPPPVLAGIDVLRADRFAALKGKSVGLVTNPTGRSADGSATADLIRAAPGAKLVALFRPDGDVPDAKTLKGVDLLVYDIQDTGTRFDPHLSLLGKVLEAAAEHKIPVLILDRPNPLGRVVQGPPADPERGSPAAWHALPVRHGMTAGELATFFVAERKLALTLNVVKCSNWTGQPFDRTGLPWVNPLPDVRSVQAAYLYPGVGLLEGTGVSVGRGTDRPFEWVGAPWIDSRTLSLTLNNRKIPGVSFVPLALTPTAGVHAKAPCGGVQIVVTRRDLDGPDGCPPLRVGLEIARALRDLYPDKWQAKDFDRLLLHKKTADAFCSGAAVDELMKKWAEEEKAFEKRREGVLLYKTVEK